MLKLRRLLPVVLPLAIGVALTAPLASAAEPKSCGVAKVLSNDKIGSRAIAKGSYRLAAVGVSCEVVAGQYGLFDQFIAQDQRTTLPKPWKLAATTGKLKFSAKAGSFFTATKVTTKSLARPAQGPQNLPCTNFKVASDQTIDKRLFLKGTYQVNAFGISCAKVVGKYGLFDQFLTQDDARALPKPWTSLVAIGQPKFVAKKGVGFRVQRISG